MFQQTCVVGLLTFSFFAGELPKELGDLVSLTHFDASDNEFQGESYAPAYMCCMFADIFTLVCRRTAQGAWRPCQFDVLRCEPQQVSRRVVCPSIHALYVLLTFSLLQESCPRSSANLSIWKLSAWLAIRSEVVCMFQHTCTVIIAKHFTFLQENCPRSSANLPI